MTSPVILVSLIALPYIAISVALWLSSLNYPAWLSRKLIHIVGLFLAPLYATILPIKEVILVFSIVFGSLILLSVPPIKLVQSLFKMGTRPGEQTKSLVINNVLTYTTMILLYFLLIEQKHIFLAASTAVAFGDGLGEIVGRTIGRLKYKVLAVKSIEGSLGVFVGSFSGAIVSFIIFDNYSRSILGVLVISSILAMGIEAISVSYIDNVLIPLVVTSSLFVGINYILI